MVTETAQLALDLEHSRPDDDGYPCPCCGARVVDVYVDGDALCCWCRDIDDPRLSDRIRAARLRRDGPRRCCLARSRGRSVVLPTLGASRYS